MIEKNRAVVTALLGAAAFIAAASGAQADDLRSIQAKGRAYRVAVDSLGGIERIPIRSDEDLARIAAITGRHIPELSKGVRHWIVEVALQEPAYRAAVAETAKSNPRLYDEMVRDFRRLEEFAGVEGAARRLKSAIARDLATFGRVAKHLEQGLQRLERDHPLDEPKLKRGQLGKARETVATLMGQLSQIWESLEFISSAEATGGALLVKQTADAFERCIAVAGDINRRCRDECEKINCSSSYWGVGRFQQMCEWRKTRCYAACGAQTAADVNSCEAVAPLM